MPTKLTEALIRNQDPPAKGAITIWDSPPKGKGATGLGVRIHAGGTKSFFLNYRLNGVERRYRIGRWPLWSVEGARAEAKAKRQEIDQGQDPAVAKRERREAPTVQELADRYKAEYLPTKSAKSQHDDWQMIEKYILPFKSDQATPKMGQRKVTEVHDGDIKALHLQISLSGHPIAANRVLAVASAMFSLSLKTKAGEAKPWRDAVMGNPCKGVKKNPEHGRERFYSPKELAIIGDALSNYGADARGPGIVSAKSAANCVRLIMLTGCRPSEARLATWDQFDAEPGFWIKPSAHTKQRRVHKLPLNPATIELIERMRPKRKTGATWIFQGQRPGEPLQQLWSIWAWVRTKAELSPDSRLYDLRHSFASIGAGHNLGLPVIGRLLGHTQPRTTQRYAHLADDPLREATKKIGNAISPPTHEPVADVVPIAKAG